MAYVAIDYENALKRVRQMIRHGCHKLATYINANVDLSITAVPYAFGSPDEKCFFRIRNHIWLPVGYRFQLFF